MTPSEISAKLALEPDPTITISDNGEWYSVTQRRMIDGQRFTHHVRLPLEPTDQDIADARQVFEIWWRELVQAAEAPF